MIMGVEQKMCLVTFGCILKVQFVESGELFVVLSNTELETAVMTI